MPGIIINEDFENFMVSYPSEKMNEDGIREQVDNYATGQVVQMCCCGNGMSAVFESKTFETLWGKIEDGPEGKIYYRGKEVTDKPLPVKTTALNGRLLHKNVKNPFQTRIDYGRSKGLKMWMSMRMNDIHWASDEDFLMNTEYWRDNPQLHRAPYNKNYWSANALDYGNQEVRRHFLSLVEEYLESFDLDGLELDWMRSPLHLRPGFEIQDSCHINEFVREVRRLADAAQKRLGHKIEIGVRLPSRPEDARLAGLDFITWANEGLINLVVATSYWASSDYNMPLELWRLLLPESVTLAAGLEILCRPNINVNPFYNTEEIVAGYATSFFSRGAEQLYLFNHMDGHVGMRDKQKFRRMLQSVGNPETAQALPRRHVITYTDEKCRAEGLVPDNLLPLKISDGIYSPLRINVGGGTLGRKAFVILGVNSEAALSVADFSVRMNTGLCVGCSDPLNIELPENDWQLFVFAVPEESLHDGNSMIEVIRNTTFEVILQWCEVYLP